MKIINFEDVQKKYLQAFDCINFEIEASLNEVAPNGITWYHHPTMVGWLFGSSQEFVKDYEALRKDFESSIVMSDTDPRGIFIAKYSVDLARMLEGFRRKIENRFPNDKTIMEALSR